MLTVNGREGESAATRTQRHKYPKPRGEEEQPDAPAARGTSAQSSEARALLPTRLCFQLAERKSIEKGDSFIYHHFQLCLATVVLISLLVS